MMWSLCLLLVLQPAGPTTAPAQTNTPDAQEEAAPAVTYDQGPLRGEVIAMFDARYWYSENPPNARESSLRMQMRVSGETIAQAVRIGTVIFDEATDDTGQSLVQPDTYTEKQRTEMRLLNRTPDYLRTNGLLLPAGMDAPNRAAQTIKLRGSVRIILASEQIELTMDNPLQYLGKTIEHPRLNELGIEIRLVTAEELVDPVPPPERMPVLQYVKGRDLVHSVSFHDAWMKLIRHRERTMKTKDDQEVVGCAVVGGGIDENSQLVLTVYPRIEDLRVPIEVDALKLP